MTSGHGQNFTDTASLGLTLTNMGSGSELQSSQTMKVSPLGSGSYYVGIKLDSLDCERIIDLLAKQRCAPDSSHFNLYFREDWWKSPSSEWVAAEFSTDHWVEISPENVFEPAFPSPCRGLIPAHFPLHVLAHPKGKIVDLKHDVIYANPVAKFMAELAPCDLREVHLDQELLPDYWRVFPRQFKNVLAESLTTTVNCAACGTVTSIQRGARLGHRVDGLAICANEFGVGHMAAEHPLLMSVDIATQFKTRFPKGFGVTPVLDIECEIGQRIAFLSSMLQSLDDFRFSGISN